MTIAPKKNDSVTSLEKALDVLEALIAAGGKLHLTEIAKRVDRSKGTVHRILDTLKKRKFAMQDPHSKMYSLGVRTIDFALSIKSQEKALKNLVTPFLSELYQKTRETVNASLFEYDQIKYFFRIESEEMLRIATPYGARFPAHCAATGKIFLAFLTDDEIEHLYHEPSSFISLTDKTITSLSRLMEEIAVVREKGIAFDDEEALVGVFCVAAPVVNEQGDCIAAISISTPKYRMTSERMDLFPALIAECGRQISEELKSPKKE